MAALTAWLLYALQGRVPTAATAEGQQGTTPMSRFTALPQITEQEPLQQQVSIRIRNGDCVSK
jgi:hypothetical protein